MVEQIVGNGRGRRFRTPHDEGIAQAERGDTVPAEEAFDRLAKRFGFSNT